MQAADCDPNYGPTTGGCVPGSRDHGCPQLRASGIADVPVLGTDWQRLDGYQDFETGAWVAPPDGLGCEWNGEWLPATREPTMWEAATPYVIRFTPPGQRVAARHRPSGNGGNPDPSARG
jgi:hypothetical protein